MLTISHRLIVWDIEESFPTLTFEEHMALTALFSSVAPLSRPQIPRDDQEEVTLGANRLRRYLESEEGIAALAMISRIRQDIRIGSEPDSRGFAQDFVYYLDGKGIRRDVEVRIMFEGYSSAIESVRLEPAQYEDYLRCVLDMWRAANFRTSEFSRPRSIKPSRIVPALRRTMKELAESLSSSP